MLLNKPHMHASENQMSSAFTRRRAVATHIQVTEPVSHFQFEGLTEQSTLFN